MASTAVEETGGVESGRVKSGGKETDEAGT
jgi:hypothetical protein